MKGKKTKNIEPQTSAESPEVLRETIRRHEATLQAKGRLLDNMAYQIRTLSNAVIGFSELLLTEELTPEQHDFAVEINTAGKGLSDLVNEVLDWARLESGRLQIARSVCSLNDILNQLDPIVRPAAEDKELRFETRLDARLPATLMTDSDRLMKCLVNLAANAVQCTSEGFVRIVVRPEVRDDTAYVRFDVIDSGPGISAEKLDRLFEPARVEEDAHAEVVTMLGMGLSVTAGLPLTRRLVELLGGTIEVQSKTGKGTTFSLLIPVGMDIATESILVRTPYTPAEANDASPNELSTGPILLAEDQESNRTVVQLMLKTMGYEVDTAVDGREAVEMALSKKYSLIIMDLKMPRMDGYEATRCLREKHAEVPIVALTALSLSQEEKSRANDLFNGFLSKPIDSEQLSAVVGKYTAGTVCKSGGAGIS